MPTWTVWDYLDGDGISAIQTWLRTFTPKTRESIRSKLVTRFMVANAEGSLKYPGFELLDGQYRHLIEVRFERNKVAYRVLACYGNVVGEVWLLVGAIEQNDQIRPPGAFDTALSRRATMLNNNMRKGPTCIFKKTN